MKYKDFKTLTKREMKDLKGGSAAAGGSCGNVLTTDTGKRCVVGGMPRAAALQESSAFNQGQGQYTIGYGGQVTDVNWCCTSCGNFEPCDKVLLDA